MSISTFLRGRNPVTLLLVAAVLLTGCAWALQQMGMAFFASYPMQAIALSAGTVLLVWLISVALKWLGETIHAGRFTWQRRLHKYLDVEEGKRIHEADWVGVVLQLLLWSLMPLVILHFWGLSETSLRLLSKFASTGFNISDGVNIVPGQIPS